MVSILNPNIMKENKKLWLIFGTFCLLSSCYQPRIEYFDSYREEVYAALKSFEHQAKEYQSMVKFAFDALEKKLTQDRVNFKPIPTYWNAKMSRMRLELDVLEDKFELIEKKATVYFIKLNEVTDSISNAQMKEKEKEFTREKSVERRDEKEGEEERRVNC